MKGWHENENEYIEIMAGKRLTKRHFYLPANVLSKGILKEGRIIEFSLDPNILWS